MIEVISIGVPLVHGQYKEWALLPGMFEADSAKLWAMMFRLRGRDCCVLRSAAKWKKLTTRPISPARFAELDSVWRMLGVQGSDAMQVISLEGCNGMLFLEVLFDPSGQPFL
jgi:hypothetical protein